MQMCYQGEFNEHLIAADGHVEMISGTTYFELGAEITLL